MKSGEQALGHVLAVVHRVTEGDGVGSFLHSNSEEFEAKMHQIVSRKLGKNKKFP